jgi:hypothetical protein
VKEIIANVRVVTLPSKAIRLSSFLKNTSLTEVKTCLDWGAEIGVFSIGFDSCWRLSKFESAAIDEGLVSGCT